MKDFKKFILPTATAALAFGTTNCESKEEKSNDKLVGQWEITEGDGDMADLVNSEYDYTINLEFHLAGDAEFCQTTTKHKVCQIGEWEWTDNKFTQLEMKIGDDEGNATIALAIDSFEGDKITGTMAISAEGEKYNGDVTLERVYTDKSALKSAEIENPGLNGTKLKSLRTIFRK